MCANKRKLTINSFDEAIELIQNGGFNKIEFEETEQGKANREFFDNLKMIREELVTKMTMDHLND